MGVQLEILDGSPQFWLSPDLWAVPGDDPEGPPGSPVAGQPCYLWARVHNTGDTPVQNATVRFYWGNPAVGLDRTTATPVGSANVTLDPGTAQDVLCLTPWVPSYVNGGHECVLAEAFHATLDPLPPGPAFNVAADRHVAQRNLAVLAPQPGMFRLAFEVHNPSREAGAFTLRVRQGELGELKPLLATLGEHLNLPGRPGDVVRLGFTSVACPTDRDLEQLGPREQGLKLPPGGRQGLTLVGAVRGGAVLLHVEQLRGERVVGGLSVLARGE